VVRRCRGLAGYGTTGALVAPARGRLVDRLGQRPALTRLAVGHTTVMLGLLTLAAAAWAPVVVLVVVADLAGVLPPPILNIMRVLWGRCWSAAVHGCRRLRGDLGGRAGRVRRRPAGRTGGLVTPRHARGRAGVAALLVLGATLGFASFACGPGQRGTPAGAGGARGSVALLGRLWPVLLPLVVRQAGLAPILLIAGLLLHRRWSPPICWSTRPQPPRERPRRSPGSPPPSTGASRSAPPWPAA
jgi:hypothetical protein